MPHLRPTTRAGFLLALLALCPLAPALAQGPAASHEEHAKSAYRGHALPTPSLQAVERTTPVRIDGRLDEAIWATAPAASDFRQQRPLDGKPATQRTEVRILFDAEAIYVGARMYDSLGAAGVRTRLARRDEEVPSDWIELIFDTYHDHVGRTSFAVNPSGVKQDAGIASAYMDPSWDAVWDVATTVDSLGWTAEFRIPLSQLRFSTGGEQTWGLQIWRTESRLNELSMWSYWGIQEAGGPSRFGHLEGLALGQRSRRTEVVPYLVGQVQELRPAPAGDPFYDAHSSRARVGGDLKYLLSNALTLDATVNPDFGQVEVDPAVVNLTAFETFFPERRPFFVAGGGNFGFGGFNCYFCSNVQNLSLFYSRRIGRAPHGALPVDAEYADVPQATSILGAAKVTGRTRSGWSVGLLDAVTASEQARYMAAGVPGTQEVEPLSNYFVGRLKRDLNGGNTMVGGMVTSTWRNLDDPLLRTTLPVHAEALGFDWNLTWKNRTYSFMGSVAGSNVAGDSASILRLQQSSARYFQRPDRQGGANGIFSDAYDPAATRLGGYGAYARVGKNAGAWLWEAAVNLRSPGFETNDLAYLTRADYLWLNANVMRDFSKPTHWYRSATLIAGGQRRSNFDGDMTEAQVHGFGRLEFLNYWDLGGFFMLRPESYDDEVLRGGPVARKPSMNYVSVFANTDRRQAVSFATQFSTVGHSEGDRGFDMGGEAVFKPASNIQVSVGPQFSRYASAQQYVTAVPDPVVTSFYGTRYVLSDVRQDDLIMNTRLNVTFTRTLSLELFAQPLISRVSYSRFKEFDAPRALHKSVYGVDRGSIRPLTDAQGAVTGYEINPGDGGQVFQLSNPDFHYQALRGNAVLRWEYRPGSTVFFVWTQSRDAFQPYVGDLSFQRDVSALRSARPDNVFMVKVNYWLSF